MEHSPFHEPSYFQSHARVDEIVEILTSVFERKCIRVDELFAHEEMEFRRQIHETGTASFTWRVIVGVPASVRTRLDFRARQQRLGGRRGGEASEERGHGVPVTA